MGLHEVTAILAIVTITVGCAGVIAIFLVALTVHRSRGRGWRHFFVRVLVLTSVIAVAALIAELLIIVWDLVTD